MEKSLSRITEVQYDYYTGIYYVELSREMLQSMDWRVGDDIEWVSEGTAYILVNKSKEERDRGNK
jgi:hypothetical protein